jgi:hypothetical protein
VDRIARELGVIDGHPRPAEGKHLRRGEAAGVGDFQPVEAKHGLHERKFGAVQRGLKVQRSRRLGLHFTSNDGVDAEVQHPGDDDQEDHEEEECTNQEFHMARLLRQKS